MAVKTTRNPVKISNHNGQRLKMFMAALGLTSLVSGCNSPQGLGLIDQVSAQAPSSPIPPATATPSPTALPPTSTATPSPTASPTASPTPTTPPSTPLPTATPWPTPVAWQPAPLELPTLTPVPIVSTATAFVQQGVVPVNYSPPDGVDVFGSGGLLRWEYYGGLAEDEWFDIKIKPYGSENSAFVDWTKTKEYDLKAWSGWQPGLYTWQIGIVKGYKEGETKHFIADTGRDSQPFVIKWQAAGGGGGGGGGGGSNGGGGGGGGGGNSGGS